MKVDILYDGNEANKLKGILNYLYERRNRQNYFSIVSATESGVEAERSSAIVLIDPEYTQTAPQKQFVTTHKCMKIQKDILGKLWHFLF